MATQWQEVQSDSVIYIEERWRQYLVESKVDKSRKQLCSVYLYITAYLDFFGEKPTKKSHHRYVHDLRTKEVTAMRKLAAEMNKLLKTQLS